MFRRLVACLVTAFLFSSPVIAQTPPASPFVDFPLPVSSNRPEGITAGPDDNVWFAASNGKKIGRITPSGTITEFAVSGYAFGITAGPDGNLWFTEYVAAGNSFVGLIGRITPTGALTEFDCSCESAGGITTGSDGNLWFTYNTGIGRMTPSGTLPQFAITIGSPAAITNGPDNNAPY